MPCILVDSATDGTSLVAAPEANRKIRVNGFSLSAAGAVTATLKDGAAGSALWQGTMATGVPHTLPPKADWEVILTANTALVRARLPIGPRRYIRLAYRVGTAAMTAGTVDAYLSLEVQAQQYGASGFSVA